MRTVILFFLFLISSSMLLAQEPNQLRAGDAAPDFTLRYATKDSISSVPVRLSDFAGKRRVILAFYPADWSTGCTKEVCTFRDNFAALENLNAEILAVSGDYVWSHLEWAKHHDLPFKLLSDHDHRVAKLYNSYNEKSLFNRRTVYVIDKRGTIAYSDPQYSVADLKDFEELKAALATVEQ